MKIRTNLLYTAIILHLILFINSCSTKIKKDSAPIYVPNLSHVHNAKPQSEPYSKYGNPRSYTVFNKNYAVFANNPPSFTDRGLASWYGTKFHGKRTSSGETYDMFKMTAAHKNLRIPAYVKVKNLDNNKEIIVRINDRGPFHKNRIIDLSYAAAKKLDILEKGTAPVEITLISTKNPILATTENTRYNPQIKTNNFYLQLGAFSQYTNAKKLVQKLKKNSIFLKNHIPINLNSTQKWHKVEIGPVPHKLLSMIKPEATQITQQVPMILEK